MWLHPISWVPALWAFSRLEGRRALLAGWFVGFSANVAIFHWLAGTVTRYGGVPRPLAVAVLCLFAAATGFYTAVFAWGFARVRVVAGSAWPVAIAAWFCALEFLNPQIFGYLQGVAWYQIPRLFLVTALTGVSGVSFLVIFCNAIVLQGIEAVASRDVLARRAMLRNLCGLAALTALAFSYSSARLTRIEKTESAATPLRIAIVQPNHTIERRIEMLRSGLETFASDMVALSRSAAESSREADRIDVYVWPEGALRADPNQRSNRAVLDFVRATGAEVWTGGNHHETGADGATVSYNSAFRVFGDGVVDQRYDKNILVPFGEYVPLAGVIPGFDRIPTVARFKAGTSIPTYSSGTARLVFLICYEAILPGFVRRAIADDVNLIVNVTVDAWYGHGAEQSQHLMLAATQSAMNGIPMVRATSTGISAFIDARGVITAKTGMFTRETAVHEVRPLRVAAPYTHWGDWFAWSTVAASAALLASSTRRRRAKA